MLGTSIDLFYCCFITYSNYGGGKLGKTEIKPMAFSRLLPTLPWLGGVGGVSMN